MRTFENFAAQGDVMFRRVCGVPDIAVPIDVVGSRLVVTHSETGHDHVMLLDRDGDVPAVEMFGDATNPLIAWIKVNRPTALDHQRPHDTHESIMFGVGVYEVRRQREYAPEGFRRVAD